MVLRLRQHNIGYTADGPYIIKDCPKMRNLHEIFLRSFENVGLGYWLIIRYVLNQ